MCKVLPRNQYFGEYLRRTREHRGVSVVKLAQMCDISDSSIYKYENGEATIGMFTFVLMMEALGIESGEAFRVAKKALEYEKQFGRNDLRNLSE